MSEPTAARTHRRVVTGMRDGRSVVVSDGPTPNAHPYESIPGMTTSVVYGTAANPSLPQPTEEVAPPGVRALPAPGETRLMVVTFPPDAVLAGPDFDPVAADAEQRLHIPGLAEAFAADEAGMHRTATVDYDIVLDGEIWMEVDDGEVVHLRQGDVVVQCGTRHAWRNRGQRPATMCFVLMGATSTRGAGPTGG